MEFSPTQLMKFLPVSISSEEMTAIDENSSYFGIPTSLLMENAGVAVARTIRDRYGSISQQILVIAGTGNNGGDGFVVARHLANMGIHVSVVLLGKPTDIKTVDARLNWDILSKMEIGVTQKVVSNVSQINNLKEEIESAQLLIDAILGTGIKGSLRAPIVSVVELMNNSKHPIISIDTPTGLNPTTGKVHGTAIQATLTVTFHRMKHGLTDMKKHTGDVEVCDIGIPLEVELFTGPGDVRLITKPRNLYSHKGDHGWVLIIGGSDVYSGAPALAALAALRTGAGLTVLAVPRSIASVVKTYSPDLIVHPLTGDVLNTKDLTLIESILPRMDALIVGPGLGLDPETQQTVCELIPIAQKMKKPILVDADGIKALKHNLSLIRGMRTVLTPHPGEFRVISGLKTHHKWQDRLQLAFEFAKTNECVLVLKGHETIITDGKRVKINKVGNPGMATGGTGDVLSGIIGTYLAQHQASFEAAVAGTWVHGTAGDLIFEEKGYHLIASDLIEKIPLVLKQFDK